MHDKSFQNFWLILFLIILNFILVLILIFAPERKNENTAQTKPTIQQLYVITDGLGTMQSSMQVLTLHGSVQYYSDSENWLYFEQMAGGFRMTLGKNGNITDHWKTTVNGTTYSCFQETLGSELIWEDENHYMFYLYSSLDMDSLLYIAQHLELSHESEENA